MITFITHNSYASIYTDEVETEILKTQDLKPLAWFSFVDDF